MLEPPRASATVAGAKCAAARARRIANALQTVIRLAAVSTQIMPRLSHNPNYNAALPNTYTTAKDSKRDYFARRGSLYQPEG